jgi:hypothetical protein
LSEEDDFMASWIGSARTNYFLVKDVEAFKAWAKAASLVVFEEDSRFGVYSEDEYGGWPQIVFDDDTTDAHRDFDITYELAQHVAEGEIVVCLEAGAEKRRYITGAAIAFKVTANGADKISLTLDDIYGLAAKRWGEEPSKVEY